MTRSFTGSSFLVTFVCKEDERDEHMRNRAFVTGQARICASTTPYGVRRTVTKEGPSYRVLCGEIQHIRLARVVLPYSIVLVLTGARGTNRQTLAVFEKKKIVCGTI